MILLATLVVFVGVRLVKWLALWTPLAVRVLVVIVYIALTASISLLLISFDGEWARIGRTIGAYWLGTFIYLSLSAIAFGIIFWAIRLITRPREKALRTMRLVRGWIVVCVTACVAVYGFIHADNPYVAWYSYDAQSNRAEQLGSDAEQAARIAFRQQDAVRIVLVSDTHLGAAATEARFPRIVDMINAQKPDVVLIAGDIFNNDFSTIESPEEIVTQFRRIEAPLDVYACLGNHDCGYGFDSMLEELEKGSVTLLREDYAIVDGRFIVVGRQDGTPITSTDNLKRGSYEAIADRIGSTRLPVIVLDHNPVHIGEYGDGVSLVLSGHTHGGQIFPLTLVTAAMYVTDHGLWQQDAQSPVLLVTSGVDYWGPPMRVGSDAEIAVIDMRL